MFMTILRFLARSVLVPAAEIFIRQYAGVAEQIIRDLFTQGTLSDETKRKLALAAIKKELKRRGIEAKDSYINLLIEHLVIKLKEVGEK